MTSSARPRTGGWSAVSGIAAAVEAIEIDSPGSFRWLGRPVAVGLPATTRTDPLTAALAGHLYRAFYVAGGPRPPTADAPGRSTPAARRAFFHRLTDANPRPHRWVGGWRVVRRAGRRLVVRGPAGVDLWLGPDEWRAQGTGSPAAGSAVRVREPSERRGLWPGYLGIHGDAVPAEPLARIYIDVGSAGAIQLVAASARWAEAGLPFGLKVVADPEGFDRRDSAVVYVARRDWARAADVLTRDAPWRSELRDGWPAFVRPVVRGVGVADGPAGGASFGETRSRQLAEGLVRAWRRGVREKAARMEVVAARFAEAGIRLDAPWLEPGLEDYDPRPWGAWK